MKYIEVQGRKGKSKKTAPSDVLHVYFLFLEGCMYVYSLVQFLVIQIFIT